MAYVIRWSVKVKSIAGRYGLAKLLLARSRKVWLHNNVFWLAGRYWRGGIAMGKRVRHIACVILRLGIASAIGAPSSAVDSGDLGREVRPAKAGASPKDAAAGGRAALQPVDEASDARRWPGLIRRLGTPAMRHPNRNGRMICSPDGNLLASLGNDDIRLWDTKSFRRVHRLEFSGGAADIAAFTSDGKMFVSGHYGGHVRIWDVVKGQLRQDLVRHNESVTRVAIAPNGRRAATVDRDGVICIWELENGALLRRIAGPRSWPDACRFSADGKQIEVVPRQNDWYCWDVETGSSLPLKSIAHRDSGRLTDDGRYIIVTKEGRHLVCDAATGVERLRLDNGQRWLPHAVSPDGSHMAVAGKDGLEIYDLSSANKTPDITVSGTQFGCCFTPDNRFVFSHGAGAQIVGWDRATRTPLPIGDGFDALIGCLAFSPDEKYLATSGAGDKDRLRLWNAEDLIEDMTFAESSKTAAQGLSDSTRHQISGLHFSPDARLLAAAGQSNVVIWSIPNGTVNKTLGVSSVAQAVFLPDGRHMALGCWQSQSHEFEILSLRTGKSAISLAEHWDCVVGVAASPFGSVVATASRDRTVVTWDLRTWERQQVLEGPTSGVLTVAVSQDGKTVAGNAETSLHAWDAETGKPLWRRDLPYYWRRPMAMSPDGKIIAIGSWPDLLLIDVVTGRDLNRVGPLDGAVNAIGFSPSGSKLAMAAADGTLWFWDVRRLVAGKTEK